MRLRKLPLKHPKPDAQDFIDIMMGRRTSSRVPLIEYIVDEMVMRPILTDLLGRDWVRPATDRDSQKAYLDNLIEFWYRMGYDLVRFERGLELSENRLLAPDTAPGSTKQRAWADEHHGTITNWQEFESYPWPQVEEMDFFPFEYLNSHLPEGMGLIANHGGGMFEHLSRIMSYEGLCLALHDDGNLVKAISDKLGELMTRFYEHLLELENLIAIMPGDDMGFRTGTLMAPSHLEEYILPWHQSFARLAHERRIPYFLHSCGNLDGIMEDLISNVGIDGKHSFEDAILPVEDFQARFAGRIAVLGGVDVNRLAADSPEDVRRHTRYLIETCGERGRFAIGSGNSIPSYVPLANYLAMIDEALA